jgi:hypothetical protein
LVVVQPDQAAPISPVVALSCFVLSEQQEITATV